MRDVSELRVLAIDTSTAVTAVAVVRGDAVLAEDDRASADKHGAVLVPRIQAVLGAAALELGDIDLLAVGVGPGSFTGLRVGLATVKGLGFALPKPVRGVSSLDAIASAALRHAEQAVVLIDAFKGEVYAGVYRRGAEGPAARGELSHAPPEQAARAVLAALEPGAPAIVCGDGARRYAGVVMPALGARAFLAEGDLDAPRGAEVARLARAVYARDGASDLATLEPAYVRGSDARLPDRPLAVDPLAGD